MTRRAMFRLQSVKYASVDEFGYSTSGRSEVYFIEIPVVKDTPKGCWLDYYGTRKFVRLDAHKKWACETKEAALESFIARKKRQIKILKAQLDDAQVLLGMAVSKKGQEEQIACQEVRA